VPEDIALFIDFENIRYSMLNIQRREPDPQELIAVARRYGTVMVARAYADWSRQPEPFKGSLTAAMIDRVDCPRSNAIAFAWEQSIIQQVHPQVHLVHLIRLRLVVVVFPLVRIHRGRGRQVILVRYLRFPSKM